MNRRLLLALAILFTATSLMAAGHKSVPYAVKEITQAEYNKVMDLKKPLFLAYNADWCPVCQKQNKTLSKVAQKFKGEALFYTVNWDKRDMYTFPITKQRTTIARIKDGKIVDRLVGVTSQDMIYAFIKKNLE
jgi:thioredoxin 1